MSKILLIGDNEITSYLKDALSKSGHIVEVENLGEINNFTYKDLSAIIDLTNAEDTNEDSKRFIHNTGAVKQLMDAAKVNNAPYLFIYKENQEPKLEDSINIAIDFISQYGKNNGYLSTIIQIEDIYGQDINTSQSLNELISNILANKPIKIVKDVNDLYLMHQDDLVSGIEKILKDFETGESKAQYTLFNPEPITEIEMVHFIKDLTDLKTQIEYSGDESEFETNVLDEETTSYFPNNWEPVVTLEKGLQDLFKKYDIPLKGEEREELTIIQTRLSQDLLEERLKLNEHYEKKNSELENEIAKLEGRLEQSKPKMEEALTPKIKKQIPAKTLLKLGATFALILALPSFIFIYSVASSIGNIDKAQKAFNALDLKTANVYGKKAYDKLHNIESIPYPILAISSIFGIPKDNSYSLLNTSKNISEMIYFASSFGISENKSNILSDNNVLGATADQTKDIELNKAYELANLVESDVFHIYSDTEFQKNKLVIEGMKNINPAIRDLLGYTSNQTYLLIFQDPEEMRATGGKIKEYAILKIENGKFNITKTGPISEIDEQLELNNALEKPPEEIVTAFNDDLFHLRDANWNPDFKQSAMKIKDLYQKGTKSEIDGVIAINYPFVKSLSITNTDKSLGAIFDEIFKDGEPQTALVHSILNGLLTKDIQIFNENEKIMNALSKNSWTGEISQSATDDYFYIVDTNLGKNDINKDIEKTVSYKARLPESDNGLNRELVITYKNLSNEINSGNSEYINYLRIFVPNDALLNSATLVTESGETNIIRSIKTSSFGPFTIYSTDILVMPEKTASLVLNYESSPKTYDGKSFSLSVQKQPGTKPEEVNIEISGRQKSIKLEKDEILKLPL
ncbi:hypothetical protein CO058_03325 [candidate division WWE3 bacterium CG_4_9_14_0_2_um_filter_35_11]|uniref:DUF4012 domain-containing protein n=1 Tax=candidate division WWE3 bacterium CG_4_9_14_0_2_um_filter_35_11 TaxID=1975077 RepID=A0A2M8EL33_UNCKA|nr:MAG: hypothetical protein COV25_00720 [candidate division WWE3 bacterium CG10_big_fil_rev_8_21_14_0_10_35_32]PJC23438.1 MAG: hypothetical protein CO058_03325 [candidate division WWE3 bacterium CG_4_9_14_0_2_um_filter_35_11]